jgi:hypothetical protein
MASVDSCTVVADGNQHRAKTPDPLQSFRGRLFQANDQKPIPSSDVSLTRAEIIQLAEKCLS